MEKIEMSLITELVNRYLENCKDKSRKDFFKFSNEKSWKLCYDAFNNSTISIEIKALFLTAYLASWGMYRGSAGLSKTNFEIHVKAIEIIKSSSVYCENGNLFPKDCISDLLDLKKNLSNYYSEQNTEKTITPTDTLISKVILGTTGSLIAYDRYAIAALKHYSISPILCNDSIQLIYNKIIDGNEQELKLLAKDRGYTVMKIVDMFLFQKGRLIESGEIATKQFLLIF